MTPKTMAMEPLLIPSTIKPPLTRSSFTSPSFHTQNAEAGCTCSGISIKHSNGQKRVPVAKNEREVLALALRALLGFRAFGVWRQGQASGASGSLLGHVSLRN